MCASRGVLRQSLRAAQLGVAWRARLDADPVGEALLQLLEVLFLQLAVLQDALDFLDRARVHLLVALTPDLLVIVLEQVVDEHALQLVELGVA